MVGIDIFPKLLQLSIYILNYLLYDLHHYQNLLNSNLVGQYQYLKKLYCMCHLRQEEDSIGVTLVMRSILLGERFFVLDLVMMLLPRIKIFGFVLSSP